ncbi:MAG: gliding motility-associated-like protein [Glaciecola sp.]|jgi:gliding motility-associated-like protein
MRIHLRQVIIIVVFYLIPFIGFSQLSPVFIPNGGQWHENVLHKMEVENGAVYMEQDGIKFAFYDEEFFHHLHADASPDSVLKIHAIKVNFVGCNVNAQVTAHDKGSALYNYFLGKDESKWTSGLSGARQLVYHDIYPHVNLKVFGTAAGLKYEFQVLPGGDVTDIKLDIEGADKVVLIRGELNIVTSTRTLVDKAPFSYLGDKLNEVNSSYVLLDSAVTFYVEPTYHTDDTLVVDPELVFSSYSGSTTNNFGYTATYDELGFLYSGSSIFDIGYPTTLGAYSVVFSSNPTGGNDWVYDPFFGWVYAGYTNTDVGLSKYDTTGTKLIYSTYLGGELCEVPHSIIVNSKDELMILGTTGSAQFPTTVGAYDSTFAGGVKVNLSRGIAVNYVNGSDIFVAKLSSDGTQLLASTYFGGSLNDGVNELLNYNYADQMRGDIAVDADDNVYISSCTYSNDLSNMSGAQSTSNGGSEGLVAKFSSDLRTIEWGSYLGGTGNDACYSLILDKGNNVIVAGGTGSNDLVTTPGVAYPTFQGLPTDGFVAKFSPDGSTIDALTYFGTAAYDQAYFVRIDDEQSIYIYGQSASMDSTLVKNAGYYSINSGMFISKLSNDLTNVLWSTTFGSGDGRINLSPTAFAVDICNNIYLSGWGSSSLGFSLIPNWILDPTGRTGHNGGRGTNGMEVTADAFKSSTNGNDFYLLVLDDEANTLQYATFFGGDDSDEHVDGGTSRFDRKGNIYQSVCAGCGGNSDFPIKPNPGAVSAVNNASCNNGVFKFDFQIPAIIADFIVPETGCLNSDYQFDNTSNTLDSTTYFWSFGDDSTSTLESPSHEYLKSGTYSVKLIIRDPVSCNLVDSVSKIIILRDDSLILSKTDTSCFGDSLQIQLVNTFPGNTVYNWSPGKAFGDSTILLPKVLTDTSKTYQLIVTAEPGCADTILHPVYVPFYTWELPDSIACKGDTVVNFVKSDSTFTSYQWARSFSYADTLNKSINDTSFKYFVEPTDTMFYLRMIDGNSCFFIDSLQVNGGNFSIEISNDTMVCDTAPIWSHVTAVDGVVDVVSWAPVLEVEQGQDSISALLNVHPGSNIYKAIVRDKRGCVDNDTIIIWHRQNIILLSKVDTSCAGDSLQILLVDSFPGNTSFDWTPGVTFSDSTILLPKVVADTVETFQLIVSFEPGCTDTVIYSVYVPYYTWDLLDSIACKGDTVNNFVKSDAVFSSYQWSSTVSLSDTLNASVSDTSFKYVVQPNDTLFYLRMIDENSCVFLDSLNVNGGDFSIEISNDTMVCDTAPIWMHLNSVSGIVDTISWTPLTGILNGQDSTSALLAVQVGLNPYQVTAVDTRGCVDTASVLITNRLNSKLYTKRDTSCVGDSLQIELSTVFIDSTKYNWNPGVLLSDSSIYKPKVLTDSSKILLVVVSEYPGCFDTIIYPIFVPELKLEFSATIACLNDTILNYVRSESSVASYQWSTDISFSNQLNTSLKDTSFVYVVSEGDTTFYIKVTDISGCMFVDSLIINGVNFQMEVNLDTLVCDTVPIWENIISHSMSGLDSISWTPTGEVTQGQDSTSALLNIYAYVSDFEIYARDTNGCVSKDSIRIVDNSLNFDLSDTTMCYGDTIQLGFELSYNPLYTFEWIPDVVFDKDSSYSKAVVNDSMKISLVVDNSFCIDTINQFIAVNKIELSLGIDTILCNNSNPISVSVSGEDSLTYYWSSNDGYADTLQKGIGLKGLTFTPGLGMTNIFVKGQDDFGCEDTAEIKVISSFYNLTYPLDSTLCYNDSILLSPNEDISGMGPLNFVWSPSEIIHSDTSLSAVSAYGPHGTWIVQVLSENQYGCKDSDVVTLNFALLDTSVIDATVDPKTILDTESAVIEVTPNNNLYDIFPAESETTQEGNEFTVFPKESKTYLLTVIDSLYEKCRNITSVDVEVLKFVCDDPYIYVPNAFTPNGDGENDVLYVRGKNITKLYFAIFNRWGQKVFETEQQHIGWDGLYEGMKIDPAVYDYYLKYECEGDEEHFKKGNITLIR